MTHEYEIHVTSKEPLGQFAEESIEDLLGGEDTDVGVEINKIDEQ